MYSILHSAAYREAASGSEAGRLRSPSLSGRPRRTISPTSIVFSKVLFSEEFPIHGLAGPLFPRVLENPKARESAAPDTDRPRNGQAGTGETERETGRRNTKTDFSFAITENRSRKM